MILSQLHQLPSTGKASLVVIVSITTLPSRSLDGKEYVRSMEAPQVFGEIKA
jgi:hypothetical protein